MNDEFDVNKLIDTETHKAAIREFDARQLAKQERIKTQVKRLVDYLCRRLKQGRYRIVVREPDYDPYYVGDMLVNPPDPQTWLQMHFWIGFFFDIDVLKEVVSVMRERGFTQCDWDLDRWFPFRVSVSVCIVPEKSHVDEV